MNVRSISLAMFLACAGSAAVGGDVEIWNDPVGDAVIRRTDPGAVGPLNPQTVLPDIVQVRLSGWQLNSPFNDPYNGSIPTSGTAHLLRLDVIFRGVVNPPGPLDTLNFSPFQFGPSPLYGYLEFDADRERDTGGEYADVAKYQHLANVARFGGMPYGSLGSARGVRWGTEVDMIYSTVPQFERSGADFALALCGCWPVSIVQEGGNGNGRFDAGETWIVNSRFWRRTGGYHLASFMTGGSGFGQYDAPVNLRWSHSTANDRTTITLIYALTMQGAAQLQGPNTPVQSTNYSAADHTSIVEGLQDIIDFVNNVPLPAGPVRDFALLWQGEDATEHLDPTRWRARALFGTSYATQQAASLFVWTDIGFDDRKGDQNSDELVTLADRLLVRQAITQLDGGPLDGDGVINGSVQIINFGPNFSSFDVNGDGRIDALDSIWYCRADVNDDLVLNVADFAAFLSYFSSGNLRADINGDGVLNVADFSAFLNAFAQGCPI